MNTLKDLFYHYAEINEPVATRGLTEAEKRFKEQLRTVPRCSEEIEEFKAQIEDQFMEVSLQAEAQGFIRGFRYAMHIAAECGIGGER